jgi:hypothetical protein
VTNPPMLYDGLDEPLLRQLCEAKDKQIAMLVQSLADMRECEQNAVDGHDEAVAWCKRKIMRTAKHNNAWLRNMQYRLVGLSEKIRELQQAEPKRRIKR